MSFSTTLPSATPEARTNAQPLETIPDKCDVLICGTGIVESILAASLAWQGSNVLHVDSQPLYGDSSAVVNIDQLKNWVDRTNRTPGLFSRALLYIPRPLESRKYSIDLSPRILFSKSDLLPLLIKSRVSKYLEFKPLGSFHTFENDSFDKVAGSKEEIFTDQTLSLLTKRSLMRFIKFVLEWNPDDTSDQDLWKPYENQPVQTFLKDRFKLEPQQITELVFSLGLCTSLDTPTKQALLRIQRYLSSLDVYGNFPVLYSMHGGAGEIAQGFCRSAAVAGAVYKLNSVLDSFNDKSQKAVFKDGSEIFVSEKVVLSAETASSLSAHTAFALPTDHSSTSTRNGFATPQHSSIPNAPTVTRMVAIVAKACAEWFAEGESAAIVVFPSGTLATNNKTAVQAVILGSGSGQCPEGESVWYLSTIEQGDNGRRNLESALEALEKSILRESTTDFEFTDIQDGDISYRDGMPILSSVKLGQSLQNFVPKQKLQYLLKLRYSQSIPQEGQLLDIATKSLHSSGERILVGPAPSAEITYDGIVNDAKTLYERIVGSDDDFFEVDFEDDDAENEDNGPAPTTDFPHPEDRAPEFGDDMDL